MVAPGGLSEQSRKWGVRGERDCEELKLRLGRQGLGQGQPSFPGEMISGLVISERLLNVTGEERGCFILLGWAGRRNRHLKLS